MTDAISSDESINWKVAIAVGAGIAGIGLAGAGLYYYQKTSSSKEGLASLVESGAQLSPRASEAKSLHEQAISLKEKGNKYFKGRSYDKAIELYTEAIRICPPEKADDLAAFHQNRAAAYDCLGNYKKVIEDCTEALSFNKKYAKALARRAKACKHLEQWNSCLEDATAAAFLEKFNNTATLQLADEALKHVGAELAKEEFAKRVPSMPSKHFIKAYLTSFANDPAFQPLETSTTQSTESGSEDDANNQSSSISGEFEKLSMSDTPFREARENASRGDYGRVVDLCTQELENDVSPNIPEALLLRSTLRLLSGENSLAVTDLQRVIDMSHVKPSVLSNALIKRATIRINMGETDEAFADFKRAQDVDPGNCDVYHHRGQLHLLLEKVNEATTDFEKCIELRPEFVIGHIQKAYADYKVALMRAQFYPAVIDEAQSKFEKLMERFPNSVEATALYAQTLVDMQRFDEASKLFEKALKLDPTNASIFVHKGLLELQWHQDFDKAVELLQEAISVDEKCDFAYETLGTLEMQRGRTTEAAELFTKATKLSKSETDMAHLLSLRTACDVQNRVAAQLGLSELPSIPLQQMMAGAGVGPNV